MNYFNQDTDEALKKCNTERLQYQDVVIRMIMQ